MTERRGEDGRSPLALRLVHAAVFLAFAAGAVTAAVPDWRRGMLALDHPYHVGSPPRALLVLGSVLAAVGAAMVLVALARGRSAPLAASWLILGGAGAAVSGASMEPPPERSSELSANITLIYLGQRVQAAMVDQLQEHGEVPVALGPWQTILKRVSPVVSPLRTRAFLQIQPQVLQVQAPEALPQPLTPGALLLYVSPDGAAFELRLVGLTEGQPRLLLDDTGAPVVLRGLYNPDLPARPVP